MRKACVIGWPISHSRSPIIHNYWLKRYGISGSYSREPVEPAALADFVRGLVEQGYEGCNVTLPHKEAAFRLVHVSDPAVRRLGVVNTIYTRHGQLLGTSTDGEGFMANLRSNLADFEPAEQCVTILGAGGAAMAVAGALVDAGAGCIVVANRSIERAVALRQKFGPAIVPVEWKDREGHLGESTLLVNTTALGMTGQPGLAINLERLPGNAVVTDIVYAPLDTELLKAARGRGLRTVGGLGMLLHQAVHGFELWFGVRPEVTKELYDIVAADVERGLAK